MISRGSKRPVTGRGEGREALDDDSLGIFGRTEQHGAGAGEAPRRGGGDGDSQLEGEEALAGLGGAAQNAGGADEEQVGEQPGQRRSGIRVCSTCM